MKIFGNEPMIDVRRAAERSLADNARWTSAKFVVQYPKDSTNPRPKMMPIQSPNGLVGCPTCVPAQVASALPCSGPVWLTVCFRPLQPCILTSPTTTTGTSPATITKNCRTSL